MYFKIWFQNVLIIAFNLLFFSAQPQSSPDSIYYRHFQGLLDTNMRVSVDLFSHNGTLEGQYYYFFRSSRINKIIYGKTISLVGISWDGQLELHELGNETSKFIGHFDGDSILTGQWQRKSYEKKVDFIFRENYSNGSIPLKFISKKSTHLLDSKNEQSGKPIQAKIELRVLAPDRNIYRQDNDSINHWISKIVMNEENYSGSTELLIENIIFDFFQSYVEATEGIKNIETTSSFNWEKKFNMRILYNETGLLSIQFSKYASTGGSHGIQMHYYKVFRISDFKALDIGDLFNNQALTKIGLLLEKKLRKLNGVPAKAPLRENGFFIDQLIPNDNFYLNHDGIGFFYNIYEIASYASGTTEIFLPYREIRQWLNKEYLPKN